MTLKKKKRIGTVVPLFSLKTKQNLQNPNGVIQDGLLFLDWLKNTGQTAWQLLPIHETQLVHGSIFEHVRSPYKGYGIGIDPRYFSKKMEGHAPLSLEAFQKEHNYWIQDYALFCALRDHFGTDNWTRWDTDIKVRNANAISKWEIKLQPKITNYIIMQWKLHNQYKMLRDKAKKNKIILIGDMQFYLPLKSPHVWINQSAFLINPNGLLPKISGIPYKPKAMYGRQVWGHPLYRWNDSASYKALTSLFLLRMHYLASLFDLIRIDHANGFFRYGSIDPVDSDKDSMCTGPGFPVFRTIVQYANDLHLHVFAEDSGLGLVDLRNAMHVLSVPGVRVIRCAYDEENNRFSHDHLNLQEYPENSISYTTTHDTETLIGYLQKLSALQKKNLAAKMNIQYNVDNKVFGINLRTALLQSPSYISLLPIQDWLLSTERINLPGSENEQNDVNWRYRLPDFVENLPGREMLF